MNDKAITFNEVIGMASGMGLNHAIGDKGVPTLVYSATSGFAMEFQVPWLKAGGVYIMEQVSKQLGAMKKSAKLEEDVFDFLNVPMNLKKINDACIEYGMVYDSDDRRFYYVQGAKALFGVDHNYIASLICTGKASLDHLKDLLDTFKDTAEFEREQSRKASGQSLVGKKAIRKKSDGKKGTRKSRNNSR